MNTKKVLKFIGKWILSTTIIMFIIVLFAPKDSDGYVTENARNLGLFLGTVIALLPIKRILNAIHEHESEKCNSKIQDSVISEAEYIIPKSKKRQTEESKALSKEVKINMERALSEDNVISFDLWYDLAGKAIKNMAKLENAGCREAAGARIKLERVESEYLWRLRDAMERQANVSIKKMQGEYKNNKVKLCKDFEDAVMSVKQNRTFDDETEHFFNAQTNRLKKEAGLLQEPAKKAKNKWCIEYADGLDGRSFEQWCADVLKMNNYLNVQVTPGSGDQGVDIIAEKDDVHYAIQCKCYSAPLGNTPVQEVHAGKSMYNCQVGVVMTNSTFTMGAKELAAKTGVLLWDRSRVISML